METNLNLFYNEEANVTIRTQQVNNEPWFVAKDVANALDIAWSGATLSNIPDDWQGMMSFNTPLRKLPRRRFAATEGHQRSGPLQTRFP